MEESYDVIVLGTGLTECVLSGLLSMEGKKVLHLDRNSYYGGECASLSLSKLFEQFRGVKYEGTNNSTATTTTTATIESGGSSLTMPPPYYGKDKDYNIDMVPKFMMASGELVEILVHTDVTRYLEFQQISGSFVYREGSGICKVPSTEYEALSSPLMGFFEKRRAKKFFEFIEKLKADEPQTWDRKNLMVMTMNQLYQQFGLEPGTQDFIGHSLALHLDEEYLEKPALITCERIKLYMKSMLRFGKSPYLYPLYGLGELPQAFARLSAIYGGTYMLNQSVDEILFDENTGKVKGVRCGSQTATCNFIITDPSYVPERTRLAHKVIRAICLLDHPIPSTGNSDSCQIIIPQRQLYRKYDVYITCVSATHQVCSPGFFIAMISTIIETDNPEGEIQFALSLLGPIREKFTWITEMLEPLEDGRNNGLYIARSYDATSHFETVCDDVKDIYFRYSGKPLEIIKRPSVEEEQENLSRSIVGAVHAV